MVHQNVRRVVSEKRRRNEGRIEGGLLLAAAGADGFEASEPVVAEPAEAVE